MTKVRLKIDIQSHWHVGSGESGGAYADALALKSRAGLPFLPGKAVKGLLRSAFLTGEQNQWFDSGDREGTLTQYVFGTEGESLASQGMLLVDSAELCSQEQAYFTANPKQTNALFDVHFSTAINTTTGSAKPNSLRSIEVALPMTLFAELTIVPKADATDSFAAIDEQMVATWVKQTAPLITRIGAKRSRGYGEVLVTVE